MDNDTLAHTKWNCKYHIEDCNTEQLSPFEPVDPFTDKPVITGKKVPEKLIWEPSGKVLQLTDIRAR